MNVFTTPSGKRAIDLDRIVCIRNYDDYIIVMLDVPEPEGGLCEMKIWYGDGGAILEAYQNQKENTDGS